MAPNSVEVELPSGIEEIRKSIIVNSHDHIYVSVRGTDKLFSVDRSVLQKVYGWVLDPASFIGMPQFISLHLDGIEPHRLAIAFTNVIELLRSGCVEIPYPFSYDEYKAVLDRLWLFEYFESCRENLCNNSTDIWTTIRTLYPGLNEIMSASSSVIRDISCLMDPTNNNEYENDFSSDSKNPNITWSFPVPVRLSSYHIRCGLRLLLRTWRLQGSNDKINWTVISDHKDDNTLNTDVI